MGVTIFNGNSNYRIDVDASLVSQNPQGNYSTIYWRIYVIKTAGSGFWSTTNMNNSGSADSHMGNAVDLWGAGNMSYDFRNGSNTGTFMIAEGRFNVPHRSDGTAEYYVIGRLNFVNLGWAEASTGTRALPRIQTATVPPAPSPLPFGNIGMKNIQYQFRNNGDGGSPVLEWQAMWQNATRNGTQNWYASNGTTDLGGLNPGEVYNFWSRGRNAVGWGPWSVMVSARTAAPAWVMHNGVWREAVPYVRVNGVWRAAQPYVNVNGVWKMAD